MGTYCGHLPCVPELPECSALNCQQNSRCVEDSLTGRLECRCSPGYEKAGLQCVCEFNSVQISIKPKFLFEVCLKAKYKGKHIKAI